MLGGDTDTNGSIVCSMIGALVGFRKLPRTKIDKVLRYDCTKDSEPRGQTFSIKYNAVKNLTKLIELRPQKGQSLKIEQ